MAALSEVEARVAELVGARDSDGAVTAIVRGYGPEILGFLRAMLKSETLAGDVFSEFCEDLVKGIGGFRGESSARTWAYTLARHAAHRQLRDPFRRRARPLSEHPSISAIEAEVRESTLSHMRSEVKTRVAELRAELDSDDQALLVLRVDRGLSWNEVARVFDDCETATLRKRFERIKNRLRARARKA